MTHEQKARDAFVGFNNGLFTGDRDLYEKDFMDAVMPLLRTAHEDGFKAGVEKCATLFETHAFDPSTATIVARTKNMGRLGGLKIGECLLAWQSAIRSLTPSEPPE